MAEHRIKCLPDYWNAIERGDKNFDVRRDDRGYQRGDTLVLLKLGSDGKIELWRRTRDDYEAKELRREITYILTGGQFGVEVGYVVLGLKIPQAHAE